MTDQDYVVPGRVDLAVDRISKLRVTQHAAGFERELAGQGEVPLECGLECGR